jgi:ribonuclease-3
LIHTPEHLCIKLGLRFHDMAWVRWALTHRSAGGANNERLEFLGDSILGFVIAEWLYERFPMADEGILSRLRASLVNQGVLAELARSFDMGDYLILGAGELKSGGYRRDSILSDVMEALIGALYLDQGMDACKAWLRRLFAARMDSLSAEPVRKDPKTSLQEWLQARNEELPVYTLLSVSGESHQPKFEVECRVALMPEASAGTGASRRRAEQEAAERMLELLLTKNRRRA